jgi:hypothetical protein
MSDAVNTIQKVWRWMSFLGWSEEGRPGSRKTDGAGKIVAHHGDITWVSDVEDACARIERQAIRDELEKREREKADDDVFDSL